MLHVQSAGVFSIGQVPTLALAFPSNLTERSLIVVGMSNENAALVPTVTDSRGHVFTQHPNSPLVIVLGPGQVGMWWCASALPGADTVTLDPGAGNDYCALAIAEYSGLDPGDAAASAFGVSGDSSDTHPITGPIEIVVPALIVGVMNRPYASGAAFTTGAGYVQRYENEDDSNSRVISYEDKLDAQPGIHTPDWTLAAGAASACLGAAFVSEFDGSSIMSAPTQWGG